MTLLKEQAGGWRLEAGGWRLEAARLVMDRHDSKLMEEELAVLRMEAQS